MKYEIGSTLCFSDEKCHNQREIHGHKLLCLGDFYVDVKFKVRRKNTAHFTELLWDFLYRSRQSLHSPEMF